MKLNKLTFSPKYSFNYTRGVSDTEYLFTEVNELIDNYLFKSEDRIRFKESKNKLSKVV